MKNKLLWRLCAFIAVGTVVLFWAIAWLTNHTETSMSFLNKVHQETLYSYGKKAEEIYLEKGEQALAAFLKEIRDKENTWLAVVNSQMTTFADTKMLDEFIDRFQIGRSPEWKVHLYFSENPVMEVPFVDDNTHFLIQLPQRMRPGSLLLATRLTLQIALPLVILSLLSFMLYRHVMTPLKQLERATKDFANGNLEARAMATMPERNDELTTLAQTFDKMAQRTSSLIYNQRSLLADLSHELRTPLARIDMAIDFVEQDINRKKALSRLRYEAKTMRELVEDTLTFAWLNTESPQLNSDDFDLVELINVICEDARFEYPDRTLTVETPECASIEKSSQLALGQALENIIRNALRHTPQKSKVSLTLVSDNHNYIITVTDEGVGVPDSMLDSIFEPFFRVDKARSSKTYVHSSKRSGFGLGLALAKRQVAAVGGEISAKNRVHNNDIATSARTHSKGTSEKKQGGLIVTITLTKLSNAAFAN
ncbi:sensor histidine kinase [Alteromonas sp. ALT199]|uniref:sensor histidine kinase n=1 Tax=unclassified Alteromonas TaxID=2614992 RepID=UPI001BE85030|nr:sensor histidine kinase [Alteromonas sp. ALT199]MBT3134489.1 sensor histidine kinase [Alteromonas sp. ALT199]